MIINSIQEYLSGVGVSNADFENLDVNDPDVQKDIASKLATSDRLYIIYNLLTRPTWEGGVGISTENKGGWHQTGGMYLEGFFTLHNKELNNVSKITLYIINIYIYFIIYSYIIL